MYFNKFNVIITYNLMKLKFIKLLQFIFLNILNDHSKNHGLLGPIFVIMIHLNVYDAQFHLESNYHIVDMPALLIHRRLMRPI